MNLILQATLSNPPTESLYFRWVTLVAKENLNLDVLIEVSQKLKDKYYRKLLRQGLMDYIEEFVTPKEHLTGLRLGATVRLAPAIKLTSIRGDNVVHLIGMIKGNVYGID